MDCRRPPGQLPVFGVEDLQVVDVPQQVHPASLLQSRVVMIGGIEVADQHPTEGLIQHLVHHLLVAATPQEIPLGGSAESPSVAIGAILPPASLVGVDHRAAPDALQNPVHRRLGLPGHLVDGPDDGAEAQAQLVDGAQIPLDGTEGQPPLFPQGRHQAEQVDAQSLFPQRHPAQVHLGHPAFLTHWASPGDEDMFGDLDRNHWQVDDLPGPLGPSAGQAGAALEAGVQDVLHPVGGGHAQNGNASPGFCTKSSLLAAGLGLDAGYPFGAARFGHSLQRLYPPLQLGDDGLLLLNDSLQLAIRASRSSRGMALRSMSASMPLI